MAAEYIPDFPSFPSRQGSRADQVCQAVHPHQEDQDLQGGLEGQDHQDYPVYQNLHCVRDHQMVPCHPLILLTQLLLVAQEDRLLNLQAHPFVL